MTQNHFIHDFEAKLFPTRGHMFEQKFQKIVFSVHVNPFWPIFRPKYLTYLNFRAPLIFAQRCAKINGSENMLPKICSILVARKLMGAKFPKNVKMC